jgi:hypothetical protein
VIDLAPQDGITSQRSMVDVGVAGRSCLAAPIGSRAEFREAISFSMVCSPGLPDGVAVSRSLGYG